MLAWIVEFTATFAEDNFVGYTGVVADTRDEAELQAREYVVKVLRMRVIRLKSMTFDMARLGVQHQAHWYQRK